MPRGWNLDGVSAIGALRGEAFHRGLPMMWEWRNAVCRGDDDTTDRWPMLGIRHEEHVLYTNPVTGQQALYDTYADESQQRNILSDKPNLVRDLTLQVEDFSKHLPGYHTRPGADAVLSR